jgi:hypothetical protein
MSWNWNIVTSKPKNEDAKMSHTAITQLEEDRQYAKLPTSDNKPYLLPKAETAMKCPETILKTNLTGEETLINLRQITMSALIRSDEEKHDYLWYYKAEVNFDIPLSMKAVPIPFLSQSIELKGDPNRRHHKTPFPRGSRKGFLRRPDLIIVRDKSVRWPGRATLDHQGVPHADNLHRVVEVKFPKDKFTDTQRDAYLHISGGRDRLTLLHVSSSGQRQEQTRTQTGNKPVLVPPPLPRDGIPRGEGRRIPVYAPKPLPEPAFYEVWLDNAQSLVLDLTTEGSAALGQLSDKVQNLLKEHAPWLLEAGRWVEDKAKQTWYFLDEQGQKGYEWTTAQLKAAWAKICRQTDLTLEEVARIEWTQVLLDLGKDLLTVVAVIAGVVVVIVITAALLAALLALIKIAAAAFAAGATVFAAFAATMGVIGLASAQ